MTLNQIIGFFAAILPILWLLISLGKLKIPAYIASIISLAISIIIGFLYFRMPAGYIIQASIEGFVLALLQIIWVIVAALFVYNITLETGGMDKIKAMLSQLSSDRRIQGLIIAYAFGGFLEAVAGFGTAVAIPAAILITMGFNPMKAAAVCLLANTVPVAFGVLGVPVITLAQVTSLPLDQLSLYTSLQLFPLAVLMPFILVFVITGGIKGIKGVTGVSFISGLVFAVAQTAALYVSPEIAAVAGSLLSLAAIIIYIKCFPVKNVWLFDTEKLDNKQAVGAVKFADAVKAWVPYILILIFIFGTRFLPSLSFLSESPFVFEKQLYFGTGGKPMKIQLLTSAGTILFISAIIGGVIQGARFKVIVKTLYKTIVQVKLTIVTVLAIVALSKVMGYSGMVDTIANMIASVSGRFYPVIAPLLGAIGTFITGSDTSSNVLFGSMQKQAAAKLGMSREWIAAANASGATAGKMLSPQSIAIATSAAGLKNCEGELLKKTYKYCIVYVIVLGIIIFVFNR